jgi:hypothetical protein
MAGTGLKRFAYALQFGCPTGLGHDATRNTENNLNATSPLLTPVGPRSVLVTLNGVFSWLVGDLKVRFFHSQ